MYSKIDKLASSFTNRLKFFKKGIGDFTYLESLQNELEFFLSSPNIDINWTKTQEIFSRKILSGNFLSPYSHHLPEESKIAYIKMLVPKNIPPKPFVCIHFAATGDQGFSKRLLGLALPLLKKKIISVILEIPYYGKRKPKTQFHVFVNTLSDFFKMAAGTILEGISLVNYFQKEGYPIVAVTGISMGGIIASYVGAFCRLRTPVISCLGPHSPESVFLKGMLSNSVAWQAIAKDLDGDIQTAREYVRSRMILYELTSLPVPLAVNSSIVIGGTKDGYVLPESVQRLHEHWKGSELRWVKAGHVSGIFTKTKQFRKAIVDAFLKEEEILALTKN